MAQRRSSTITRSRAKAVITRSAPSAQSRLWHGGVHLRAEKGSPVYAPFAGKIVAARMTDDVPGRLAQLRAHPQRHCRSARRRSRFWTLLFHLDRGARRSGKHVPAWSRRRQPQLGRRSGAARRSTSRPATSSATSARPGRRAASTGQLHVEVMSVDEIGEKIEPGFWTHRRRRGHGPLLRRARDRRQHRQAVGRRQEGWPAVAHRGASTSSRPNPRARGVSQAGRAPRQRVGRQQRLAGGAQPHARFRRCCPSRSGRDCSAIRSSRSCGGPTRCSDAAGLPADKLVWNYHPITFIVWLHDQLRGARRRRRASAARARSRARRRRRTSRTTATPPRASPTTRTCSSATAARSSS